MKAQNIYDNQKFFDGYKKIREDKLNANDLEEIPALLSLTEDLHGKKVIDLGCGYGEHCALFKKLGASKVVGVDVSAKMLEVAKAENKGIDFVRADISDLSFVKEKFDVVFSSLTFHYIKDFDSLIKQIYSILKKGGHLIFSQESPLSTAPKNGPTWTKDENGNALFYNLADYALPGKRQVKWFVDEVVMYHRTYADVVNGLVSNGFAIEKMLEPLPPKAILAKEPKLKRRYHKPNFLLVRAVKK